MAVLFRVGRPVELKHLWNVAVNSTSTATLDGLDLRLLGCWFASHPAFENLIGNHPDSSAARTDVLTWQSSIDEQLPNLTGCKI
jgi:hypothetical protein